MNPAEGEARMLAHDVYFTLHDNSPAARQKLVDACRKYLSGHPGQVWFAAGTLAAELTREVNDRDFDVALHVVFQSQADHDRYQRAEPHLRFIAESKANWKRVRVFDSWLG
jgi:heme-degrading monooxygenase HmoA